MDTNDAMLFGKEYDALKGEVQGELSKIGCTFVSNSNKSDWAIYITSVAREHNIVNIHGMEQFYVYVDTKIIIDKTTTGQRLYENSIRDKGGHTHNFEKSALQAYQDLSHKLSTIIKEQIQ